ncbi:MAG: hypothetical protein RLZZ129_533 [Verrucomicrobiota bacterium]|jgi:hypothetical protein
MPSLLRSTGGWFLLSLVTVCAAPPEKFSPRALSREPAAPRLASPLAGDVLADAVVTASHHEPGYVPEFANNDNHDDNILHWATKQWPAWIRFDLPEARPVAEIHLWFFASGGRTHQFVIEGSDDGINWQILVDRNENKIPATLRAEKFVLSEPVTVKALRLTVTGSSKPEDGLTLLEVDAFAQPVQAELGGAVAEIHRRLVPADLPVTDGSRQWTATAWRCERVHGRFVVWTDARREGLRAEVSALHTAAGATLPAEAVRVRFVKQVLADDELAGDLLEEAMRMPMPAGSWRELWLTVEPDRAAAPGIYTGTLTVRADDTAPLEFPLTVEVLPATLPAPADWKFHLDLWQHPWAIARWHDVAPWSEEHFRLMRPYLTELANAGQKIITATITDRPWGRRDHDDYRSMVEHIRNADGSWTFDYTMFDRYVELAMDCGITGQINCYSLLTWSGRLYYTDAATGDERFMLCDTTGPEFAEYWAPFLRDFERHLAAKGWLERARLAVDEAPAQMMQAMTELVKANAPRLRISLAGNQAPSHYTGLDLAEFSIILDHASDELLRDIASRKAEGRITTFYVCLDPKRPNTFVKSPPAEAVWIGYYTAVNGYDGFLRWAWTTWPENPLRDTSYWGHPYLHYLPAGDAFLLYPGPRSSVRWELLRDGFEEWEKLRLLREAHGGTLSAELQALLERFRNPKELGDDETLIRDVQVMRAAVEASARALRP